MCLSVCVEVGGGLLNMVDIPLGIWVDGNDEKASLGGTFSNISCSYCGQVERDNMRPKVNWSWCWVVRIWQDWFTASFKYGHCLFVCCCMP